MSLSRNIGLFLLFFTTNIYTSETKNDFCEITEKCHQQINDIKKDVIKLRWFCQGFFLGMAEHQEQKKLNSPDYQPLEKPSDVLAFLANPEKNDDLKNMPHSTYVLFLTTKKSADLDELFINKYNENKDITATWKWFDDYFAEQVLKPETNAVLDRIVTNNSTKIAWERKGVFISADGKTWTIDPANARKN